MLYISSSVDKCFCCFYDKSTIHIYTYLHTLSRRDALPFWRGEGIDDRRNAVRGEFAEIGRAVGALGDADDLSCVVAHAQEPRGQAAGPAVDHIDRNGGEERKSTRLNSSH